MNTPLTPMPDDWKQALAVVAHPDDLEYGAASAIARWTGEGRSIAYVMVTDGGRHRDGLSPEEAAPIRRQEQVASAGVVGVDDVIFLGHPDGVVEPGLGLRRAITREIRRVRPDILITATPALTIGMKAGQRFRGKGLRHARTRTDWRREECFDGREAYLGPHHVCGTRSPSAR